MSLIHFSIKHTVLILAAFVAICFGGIYSAYQLKLEAYPDVSDTEVVIITEFDGRAAAEIEKLVTIPIEREIRGLPGLLTVWSQSIFGLSVVRLTFKEDTNDYFARNLVNEKLKAVILPEGATKPELGPLSTPVGEILRYVIESDSISAMDLRSFQDWELDPRLKQIQGVADIITFGGEIKQYQIETNPINQDKYNITLHDLVKAVEDNNSNTGGNILKRGNQAIPVRAIGAVENEKDIEDIIVAERKDLPIHVRDIGKVKVIPFPPKGVLGYKFNESKHDVHSGVEGIVMMRRGENPSQVLRLVKEKIQSLEGFLKSKGVKLKTLYDREDLVSNTLKTVSHTMIEGITVVVFILIFFLRSIKVALIVSITIPFSLLFSFLLMHFTEIPANLLSLGAIDFGVIVDSSIVIIEGIIVSIAGKIFQKKEDLDEIIKQSASRTEKEVFFSILIILCAYLPIFLFQRVEGRLFKPMAYGLCFTLVGALIFSLTVLPTLTGFILKNNDTHTKEEMNKIIIYFKKIFKFDSEKASIFYRIRDFYIEHLLELVYESRSWINRIYLVVGVVILICYFLIGTEFLPVLEEGAIYFRAKLPTGIHLDQTAKFADFLRGVITEFPEVNTVVTQSGRNEDGTDPFGPNRMEGLITLTDMAEWKTVHSKPEFISKLRTKMERNLPGAKISISQPILDNVAEAVTGSAADISIQITGRDIHVLWQKAHEVMDTISTIRGVSAIGIEQEGASTELVITLDRDAAARVGINFSDIQEITEMAIGGKEISRLYKDNQVYKITVRYPEEYRASLNSIANINIRSRNNKKFPLGSVAKLEFKEMPAKIARKNGERMFSVWVSIEGRDQGGFVKEARDIVLKKVSIPEGIYIEWGGQFENLTRASKRLMIAVPITFFIILIILYIMFNNLTDTFLVMSNIPIAVCGGLSLLLIRGMHFNVSSGVGFISLFGISIMGGVLFVSNFNHEVLEKKPMNMTEIEKILIRVAENQFRPRFMTISVAILGLLPAMFSSDIGSDIQRPMATVIVGGLLTTLIIGLYTTPMFCYLREMKKINNPDST